MELTQAGDLIDATQNLDRVRGGVGRCQDVRGDALEDVPTTCVSCRPGRAPASARSICPPRQNGSSIMPGKVNPVIPEVVNQVAFLIIGNDMTVTMAAEGGPAGAQRL